MFKSPIKANTDLHDGDLKQNIFNKTSTSKPHLNLLILNKNFCRHVKKSG